MEVVGASAICIAILLAFSVGDNNDKGKINIVGNLVLDCRLISKCCGNTHLIIFSLKRAFVSKDVTSLQISSSVVYLCVVSIMVKQSIYAFPFLLFLVSNSPAMHVAIPFL